MPSTEWVVGVDPDTGEQMIAHTGDPWFVCGYAGHGTTPAEYFGLTIESGDTIFYNFQWSDGLPSEDTLTRLCREMLAAISRR